MTDMLSASDTVPGPTAPTVLVVDDDSANVASLERIFQREGMRVLSATGAKAALELVRTHRVEVVLSDVMMPGVSGLELLRAVKSPPTAPSSARSRRCARVLTTSSRSRSSA
jgi:two-component system response regulator HydG